jgi:ubiquinone/menaquinone biosynthesis C-methylase UbiE
MNKKYNHWEDVYSENTFRNKNEYPSEDIVSFMMRKYGFIEDKSSIDVLDLGCGWGNNLKFLDEKGFSSKGVDISKTAVQHCVKSGYKAFECDFNKLPFDNNSFDVVIDRQSLQHNEIEDIHLTISEIYRVMKEKGTFFTTIVSQGNYNIKTTYMDESEIINALSSFEIISFDKKSRTYNNQAAKLEFFIIEAKKI